MDPVDGYCKVCDNTGHEPIRLVVACAPDDGVCDACVEGLTFDMDDEPLCRRCDGLGKALSSANVAKEVCGFEFDRPAMANWRTRVVAPFAPLLFKRAHSIDDMVAGDQQSEKMRP
jgi:phage major head subunit gpT-like protein